MRLNVEISGQAEIEFGPEARKLIKRLVRAIEALHPVSTAEQGEFHLMITVKDDNPDVQYSLSVDVTDSEGNPITDPAVLATLVTEVVSDNPAVVSITPNADPKSGNVKFGSPGLASVTATIKTASGTLLGSGGVQVTVTTGDPAAVSNIKLQLGDLKDQ